MDGLSGDYESYNDDDFHLLKPISHFTIFTYPILSHKLEIMVILFSLSFVK